MMEPIIAEKDLKQLQQKEILLLDEFDRVCKKNNLKYSIAFGTLLGAVRHKGFIPWDDDIDVTMPIEDYLRLAEIANKEFAEDFFFQSTKSNKLFYIYWNKLRLNNTTSIVRGYEQIDLHWGICMDIFPVFKHPTNPKTAKKHIKYINICTAILESTLFKAGKKKKSSLKNKVLYFGVSLLPRKLANKIAMHFFNKVAKYNDDYDCLVDYCELFKRVIFYDKDFYENMIELEFEGKNYNAPKNYEKHLKDLYNNYMKLPPKEERVAHGDLILSFDKSWEKIKNER